MKSVLLSVFLSAWACWGSTVSLCDNVSSVSVLTKDPILSASLTVPTAFTAADGSSVAASTATAVTLTAGAFCLTLAPNYDTSGLYVLSYTATSGLVYSEILTIPISANTLLLYNARMPGATLTTTSNTISPIALPSKPTSAQASYRNGVIGGEYGEVFVPTTSTTIVAAKNIYVDAWKFFNTSGSSINVTITDISTNCGGSACTHTYAIAAGQEWYPARHGEHYTGGIKWNASATGLEGWITWRQ